MTDEVNTLRSDLKRVEKGNYNLLGERLSALNQATSMESSLLMNKEQATSNTNNTYGAVRHKLHRELVRPTQSTSRSRRQFFSNSNRSGRLCRASH